MLGTVLVLEVARAERAHGGALELQRREQPLMIGQGGADAAPEDHRAG
jgi:hypothetical protein